MATNGWDLTTKGMKKVLVFTTFSELTRFLVALASVADTRNHHPDLRVFRASHLEIYLITHDTGTVTEKDEALAMIIDELVQDFQLK